MKKVFLSIMCLSILAACTNQNSTGSKNPTETQEIATVATADTANAPVFKFEKEVYEKMVNTRKKRYDTWNNEAHRAAISEANKKRWNEEENRKKLGRVWKIL